MYREWIKKGTLKPGKSRAGLAKAITQALKLDPPMSRTAIYKIIAGTRDIHANELEPASRYMEEPIPFLGDFIVQAEQSAIDVVGNVQVGFWIDSNVISETVHEKIVVLKDHEFPNARHTAYHVKDDSMNGIRVFEGDTIVCVAFKDTKLKLADNMNVVIERKNSDGLTELTLRSVEIKKDGVEFKSRCSNKDYKSVSMSHKPKAGGERITVVGLLRRSIRNY